MAEWNVGDRVVCTRDHPDGNKTILAGDIGTVCVALNRRVGVCWDNVIEGGHTCLHNGEDHCAKGHGWFVWIDNVAPCIEQDIEFEFSEEEFIKLIFGEKED